jgi:hypothetical protein
MAGNSSDTTIRTSQVRIDRSDQVIRLTAKRRRRAEITVERTLAALDRSAARLAPDAGRYVAGQASRPEKTR